MPTKKNGKSICEKFGAAPMLFALSAGLIAVPMGGACTALAMIAGIGLAIVPEGQKASLIRITRQYRSSATAGKILRRRQIACVTLSLLTGAAIDAVRPPFQARHVMGAHSQTIKAPMPASRPKPDQPHNG